MVLAKAEEARGREARALPHRQPRAPQRLRLRQHLPLAIHQQHRQRKEQRPHEAQDVDVVLVQQSIQGLRQQLLTHQPHQLHQLLQARVNRGNRLRPHRGNQQLHAPKVGPEELVDEAVRGLLPQVATEWY